MEHTGSDEDRRLMGRVRRGDLTALASLFRRHAGAIHGFFFRTTGSAAAAEDLSQDVFLRVLRYRSSFRPAHPFRVWLYRIARNVLVDHRAQSRHDDPLDDLVHEPRSPAASPIERFEAEEARTLVRRALLQLSPPERELLVLARFHELRHAELAELFDCSPGAVKVRVHRALKRLALALESLHAEVSR